MLTTEFKRPESVLVVIYTRQGEVLLLQRVQPNTFWQSVTGSLKWGEQPFAAAQRELWEETGLKTTTGRLLDWHHQESFKIRPPWKARYAPTASQNREHWFRFELSSRRSIRLNAPEHQQARWFPITQAFSQASSWTNRKAISWLLPTRVGVE